MIQTENFGEPTDSKNFLGFSGPWLETTPTWTSYNLFLVFLVLQKSQIFWPDILSETALLNVSNYLPCHVNQRRSQMAQTTSNRDPGGEMLESNMNCGRR